MASSCFLFPPLKLFKISSNLFKLQFFNFEERLHQHFFRFRDEQFGFPEFKNDEHQKEWEQLMKRHQRELEELKKKWQEHEPTGRKI